MTPVNVFILLLTIAVDASFSARLGPVALAPHLSTIFLLYLSFRRPFAQVFTAVAAYTVLTRPFTGLNPAGIALGHWGALYVVHRLRRKMFAESYLTNAAWTAIFSWILQWSADFELNGLGVFRVAAWRAIEFAANSAVIGFFTVPLFLLWDKAFRTSWRRKGAAA